MPFYPLGTVGTPLSPQYGDPFQNTGILIEPFRYIRSRNYEEGSTGWTINMDGSAEFSDITLTGDFSSSNWDGGTDLSSFDATATAGFFFDSSLGAAQLMGDVWVGGDLTLSGNGVFRTAESGTRLEIDLNAFGSDRIVWYTGDAAEEQEGYIQVNNFLSGYGALSLRSPQMTSSGKVGYGAVSLVSDSFNSPSSVTGSFVSYTDDTNWDSYTKLESQAQAGGDARTDIWAATSLSTGSATISLSAVAASSYVGKISLLAQGSTSSVVDIDSDGQITMHADEDITIIAGSGDQMSLGVGSEIIRLQTESTSLSGAGYRGASNLRTLSALGNTSGNRRAISSFLVPTGNNVFLDITSVRNTTGSGWSNMAIGIERRTDATEQASIWFDAGAIGINDSQPTAVGAGGYRLVVNGPLAVKPSTTGSTSAGFWGSGGSGYYQWFRNTSSRRYKFDIDYDESWEDMFANATLPQLTRHGRKDADDERERFFGMVAEDLLKLNPGLVGEALVNRDEEDRIESPDMLQLIYVLAAKVKRLEAQLAAA